MENNFFKYCSCIYCQHSLKFKKCQESNRRLWVRRLCVGDTVVNWLEIPKNGSTTLKKYFSHRPGESHSSDEKNTKTATENALELQLNPREILKNSDDLTIAITRCPYERFISLHNYFTLGSKAEKGYSAFRKKYSKIFKRYSEARSTIQAEWDSGISVEKFIETMPFFCAGDRPHHLWPQSFFLPDDISGIKLIDMENLSYEIGKIFNIQAAEVCNLNTQTYSKPHLSKEARDMIFEMYEDDFKNLGYER